MADASTDEQEAVNPPPKDDVEPPKWRKLIRQNSEKLGMLAEDVVLPKNQRSLKRAPISTDVALQQVYSDCAYRPTVTRRSPEIEPKYFPVFMIGISIVQVSLMYFSNNDFLIMRFGYDPHRRYEFWRFITLLLAHTGPSHLWLNVLLQMILGVLLEIIHNWKRIAIIYFSSVVGGSLFITLLDPRRYAVGASAGVYGLLFSHSSTIILNWYEMDRKCCRLVLLLLYIIIDFAISLNQALRPDAETNYAGHLGGAITGFLVSIVVLKSFEKREWEGIMQKICVGILATLCAIIIFVNMFACDHYLPMEYNSHYEDTYRDYVFNLAIASPENSTTRQYCLHDTKCRLKLNQFKFNGTLRDLD